MKTDGDDASSGTAWETAFATLTKAAGTARNGDQVWAAWGTFQEGAELAIKEGVSFYGGFAGTEVLLDERDSETTPTIIEGKGNHRCVMNYGLIDGFHITKGSYDYGAGINNSRGEITNCRIYGWCYNSTCFKHFFRSRTMDCFSDVCMGICWSYCIYFT